MKSIFLFIFLFIFHPFSFVLSAEQVTWEIEAPIKSSWVEGDILRVSIKGVSNPKDLLLLRDKNILTVFYVAHTEENKNLFFLDLIASKSGRSSQQEVVRVLDKRVILNLSSSIEVLPLMAKKNEFYYYPAYFKKNRPIWYLLTPLFFLLLFSLYFIQKKIKEHKTKEQKEKEQSYWRDVIEKIKKREEVEDFFYRRDLWGSLIRDTDLIEDYKFFMHSILYKKIWAEEDLRLALDWVSKIKDRI